MPWLFEVVAAKPIQPVTACLDFATCGSKNWNIKIERRELTSKLL
jgi:hypothetical protein